FPNVTVPGPLNLLHVVVSTGGGGKPSSLAVSLKLAVAGRVMVWSVPALTKGAWLTGDTGLTVICTSSNEVSAPSPAVSRSTYTPDTLKLAVVFNALTLPNVTVPGPLNLLHVLVSTGGAGKPSSLADPLRLAVAGSVMVWSDPA